MAEVFLRRLSRWQAEQQREAVANLYVEAYRGVAGAEYSDRQGFLGRFERDVQQPDFDMVVADSGGLVGALYGHRAAPTGEWWEGFRGILPAGVEEQTASGRVFLLSELMVAPAHRGKGVATRLRTLLLARHTADAVVAVIKRDDELGREVLRAWEWAKLGEFDPGREGWLRAPTPLP
ncbi:GNAT family N-acetyltransferase [Streptomyces sp. BG9H]|uniref:GNAT family N-acetyltransferase n=2 Tax=Streptomyces anatolicus TaxID=2675858 RepID=A0ABS6YWP4_9ACTN|nr:GNAT family N-acetyltransferase [Streptomyces anatolicus]